MYGIRPYLLPIANATYHAKDVESWKTTLYNFVNDTQKLMAIYHTRSISESANLMMIKKMPVKAGKKLLLIKKNEEILKINKYNLRQYRYLSHTGPKMTKDCGELYLK